MEVSIDSWFSQDTETSSDVHFPIGSIVTVMKRIRLIFMIRELGSFDERKSGRVGALVGGVPCLTCVRIPAPPAPGTGGEILPPQPC